MALLNRRKVILAKIETPPGTDAAPVAAADGVLVRDVTVKPLDLKYVDRSLVRDFLGRFEQMPTEKVVRVTIEQELAGFGTAGPASPQPGYDALLRGCGFARTITATTKVDYTPASSSLSTLTLYFYQGGTVHKVTYARGTATLSLKRNAIPTIKYEYVGLDSEIADAALPAPTLTGFQRPLVVNAANTTGFSIHANAGIALDSLEISLGNDIVYRNLVNASESVELVDRAPSGKLVVEATTVAVMDWWTKIRNATLGALAIQHGQTAGNIVSLASTLVQLTNPDFSEQDKIVMASFDMNFVPNAGNDELTLTIK